MPLRRMFLLQKGDLGFECVDCVSNALTYLWDVNQSDM